MGYPMAEQDRYKKKLGYFKKDELHRLIKIFNQSEISGTKNELISYLIDNHFEDIISFFDQYRKLKGVSKYRAKEFLKRFLPDEPKEIDTIENNKDLLIFLYEKDMTDKLERLCFHSSLKRKEIRYPYILTSEADYSLEKITENLKKFKREWNEKNYYKIDTEYYIEKEGESLIITIKKEYGPKTFSQFKFRKAFSNQESKDNFKIEKLKLFPLYFRKIELTKTGKGTYNFVFGFDPNDEKTLISFLANTVFGKNSTLAKAEIEGVKNLEKEIQTSLAEKPDWEEIDALLLKKRKDVINKIQNNTKFSPEKRKDLMEVADSIKYAGPSLRNDPKTTARNITLLVGDYSIFGKIVNSASSFVKEIFKKVPKSRENIVLSINGKPVLFKNGELQPGARLSEDEELVLGLLSGVENE